VRVGIVTRLGPRAEAGRNPPRSDTFSPILVVHHAGALAGWTVAGTVGMGIGRGAMLFLIAAIDSSTSAD
jgi:hypothetical protein